MFAAFLTTILFSISAVTATRVTRIIGGLEANFWRLLLASLFLAIWIAGFGNPISLAAFPMFFLSGIIGFGVGDLALFQALPTLGSRLTILIVQCLAAPFAAAFEWAWLGTRVGFMQAVWGAIILAGVALALAPAEKTTSASKARTVGLFFAIVAAVGQGFGAVLSRKAFGIAGSAQENVDGISAAFERILGGLLVVALWTFCAAGIARPKTPRNSSGKFKSIWLWTVINSLAGPTIGVSCYQWALKTTPTAVVLPIVAATPIVIIPFAMLFEGEKPGARSLLGGLLAVIGAAGLALSRH